MTSAIEMQSVSASNAQKSWVESTVRGFEELSLRRNAAAARLWLEADAALPEEVAFDPLRAASRSNAAAAHLLLGARHEADRCFGAAERSWQAVIVGIETLDVPMTGASSSFHFRLAAQTAGAFVAARRARYRRLAEAALAITRFNRGVLGARNPAAIRAAGRSHALRLVLSETLGPASPEVRLLAIFPGSIESASVAAIFREKSDAIAARVPTFAAVLSQECAQLESAVALTALLPLPAFQDSRAGEDTTTEATQIELE